MKIIVLLPKREEKIRNFYQWVFRDDFYPPETVPAAGEVVRIVSSRGEFVALGFYNNEAQIPVRVLSLKEQPVEEILTTKLINSLRLRGNEPFARYVYAESDFLPGLIIDRFGEYFVMQIRNPGLEQYADLISDVLVHTFHVSGILLRNDFRTSREKILDRGVKVLYGEVPRDKVLIKENGLQFLVDLYGGQKTGYFYDQRHNRKKVLGKTVPGTFGLDLYTYTGSFAIHAAAKGSRVIAVDSSASDLEVARKNAELNDVGHRITFEQAEVTEFLGRMREPVDFIIMDPPGLAKRKGELDKARFLLVEQLILALDLLKPGGWMVVFSCSYLMDWQFMLNAIRIAASKVRVPVYLEEISLQDFDHPVLLQMPESLYLKGFWLKKGELP